MSRAPGRGQSRPVTGSRSKRVVSGRAWPGLQCRAVLKEWRPGPESVTSAGFGGSVSGLWEMESTSLIQNGFPGRQTPHRKGESPKSSTEVVGRTPSDRLHLAHLVVQFCSVSPLNCLKSAARLGPEHESWPFGRVIKHGPTLASRRLKWSAKGKWVTLEKSGVCLSP